MLKTKVRVMGEPGLCEKVAAVIIGSFVTVNAQKFDRAVGRDYAHSKASGVTYYFEIKKPREASS